MITNIIFRRSDSPITSDKPHYENVPFEIPDNWVWTTLGEIFTLQAGKNITAKDIYTEKSEEFKYPCFGGNGIRGYVAISNKIGEYPIIGRQGALCGNINLAHGIFYATEHAVVVERYCDTDLMWGYYTLIALNLNQYATATAQPGLAVNVINDVAIPLPPLHEQQRISKSIKILFSFLDAIECKKLYLKTAISQTKTKVLDLAIHGRLVPQDPTDEPATELLKRINPKAEITSDNGHYQKLPEGWAILKVGDVAEYINGRAFKPEEWEQTGLPIIRIQNLNDPNAYYNRTKNEYEEKYLIKKGDLLFAWAASLGTYIWKGEDAWLNQHIFKVVPYPFMDKKYLYYAFHAMITEFYRKSHGSGMIHITRKQFEEITLWLPPLAEQYRIVQYLQQVFEKLDSIVENL